MTKISKVLLFLFCVVCLCCYVGCSVNAQTINLGTPTAQTYYDNAYHSGSAQLVGWWGSNNYYSIRTPSPYLGGSSGGGSIVYRHVYTWNNANLCSGQNMLIKGYVGGLTNAFTQGVSIAVYNNTYAMNCSQQIGQNGSQIYYQCSGMGGGKLEIFFLLNEYYSKYFETAVSKSIDITCDVGNADIITNNNNNTQNIINNNNNNTQSIINNQNQNSINTQQKIDNIDNTLKDSSIDTNNTTSSASDWNNKVASNGTITNLLTLPIQLMQGYVNGMNSSCTPFNLGTLFGTTIILPCINIGELIGSSLWSVIDILFSGFMIFGIAKKLIKIFNDFTNMKSNQVDELYGGGV